MHDARGWAYHGRLDLASGVKSLCMTESCALTCTDQATIAFAFDGAHEVDRVRITSGLGMGDHHITAFQLWAFYPENLSPSPPPEAGPAASTSASVIAAAIHQRELAESTALQHRLTLLQQVRQHVFVLPVFTVLLLYDSLSVLLSATSSAAAAPPDDVAAWPHAPARHLSLSLSLSRARALSLPSSSSCSHMSK